MQNLLRSRFLRGCLICIFSLASSYGHGLGVLTINQEVAFELSYTHRGAAPLAVAEALADCDCVTVLDFPREIAPGETIRIPCVYRSPRMGRILAHVQLRAVAGGPALAFLPVEGVVVEPDWMVSASDLDKNEWSGARLIDIRDEADFARLRLPGALSAPRFSLAGRQDIGPAAWILYDQGYDPVSLLTEVALLRASGHPRVYALDGGLIGWLREGRAVQGRFSSRVPFAEITSWQFNALRDTTRWCTLGVGPVPSDTVFDARATDVAAAIDFLESPQARGDVVRWLLVSSDPNTAEQLEMRLSPAVLRTVYPLAGGLAAWEDHARLDQKLASSPPAGRGTVTGQSRSHLPPARVGVPGCGTCGKK